MSWMDFNTAEEQRDMGELIPHGTIAKVIAKIKPGGADPDGLATKANTGSVYLAMEYTVMGGPYNKRKVWSNIGLMSPKGPKWGEMGRAQIRAMIESARGIRPDDTSDAAINARKLGSLKDLDGLEFVAKIEVEDGEGTNPTTGQPNKAKNRIQIAITPVHRDYAAVMGGASAPASAPAAAPQAAAKPAGGLPAWAQ